MVFDFGTGIAIMTAGLSGVVWAVRTEGRVNTIESLRVEDNKQADERHEDLKDRLVRIETKLDQGFKNGKG